jgi:hypothetical protein
MGSKVVIYSILGQELQTTILDEKETYIDVSNYQNGIYIVHLNGPNGTQTSKFIKK